MAEKPSVVAGVELLFGELDKKYPKHGWKQCEKLPWRKLLDEWVEWLDVLVKEHKPPLVRLVWFETPESLNDTMTSVSGWKEVGRKDDAWGADEDRVWPINEEGNTLERGKFMMPLVDEAMEMGGWGDKCEDDAVQAAVHAVVYGVNLLLVLNGLPLSRLAKEQREPLGVTCGWASGDCDVVGGLVDGEWGKFPRGTLARKPTEPPDDRMAELFPLQYLKCGGDPNWRGKTSGETLLFRAWLNDI
ncbi:MAG: hypothetical protein KGS45_10025 [Planctomycetes bacterium]|nr:hypothetical protein [Planctomycetota bacterium]